MEDASSEAEGRRSQRWTVQHLPGEHLPAYLFTKALPMQRFQALLPLVGVFSPPPQLSEVEVNRSKWTQAALALWAFSVPQMLKGSALAEMEGEGSDQAWIWLMSVALGVILLWEGLKVASRPCLRRLGFVAPEHETSTGLSRPSRSV